MNEQKKQNGGIWQPPVQTPQENFQERQRLSEKAYDLAMDADLAARSTPKAAPAPKKKPAADNSATKNRTASRKKSAERSKARKTLTTEEALRIYHEGTDEHTEMARALFGPDVVVRTAGGSIKAK